MDIRQLIKFLNRVYVWMPENNPIRGEVKQVINQLKSSLPK